MLPHQQHLIYFSLTGHCSSTSCRPDNENHFVNDPQTWTDPQSYCRKKYTDLATIDNMDKMNRLINAVDSRYNELARIGLEKGECKTWHWSLADNEFIEKETHWKPGEPNDLGSNAC